MLLAAATVLVAVAVATAGPISFVARVAPHIARRLTGGASFVARTHATQVKHMMEVFERAILHPGFSVVEVLSECVVFYPGAFDAGNPRKGGAFDLIEERKWDDTPEDAERHDVSDENAAYRLASLPFPVKFGVFYETDRPTKNQLEQIWIDASREKVGNASAADLLSARFAAMK